MRIRSVPCGLVAIGLAAATHAGAATVHRFNVIAVPTAVVDFETAPDLIPGDVWVQDGLRIQQVDGVPGTVWSGSGLGEGTRSWYPGIGDVGWTRITREDGSAFDAVSFLAGSGFIVPGQSIYYELALGAAVVQAGHEDASFAGDWFGITGGGYDEIRLRATWGPWDELHGCGFPTAGGACNFLWLDNFQIGAAAVVPVPSPAVLLLGGVAAMLRFGGAAGVRRRR